MIIELIFGIIFSTIFITIHELGHYLILIYKKYVNVCIVIVFIKKWFVLLPFGFACYGHKEFDDTNMIQVLKSLDECLFMIWGAVATTTIFAFGSFILGLIKLDTLIIFMFTIIIYNKYENSDMINQFINPQLKSKLKYYIIYAPNKLEYIEKDSLTNGKFEVINLKKWIK